MVEYSGIATSSALDVNAGASGTGTNLNSGTTTTTNASDLLVGASYIGGRFRLHRHWLHQARGHGSR